MISSILQLFDLSFILSLLQQSQDAPIEAIKLFGIKLMNPHDFWELVLRFSFNMLVTFILIRGIYYRSNKRKDYFFIYFLMNTIVFLICFMLENVTLELGFALGLFALFGIIRYRTDPIPIKEMTYLFVVVGVAIINALSNRKISYAEMMFTNLAILGITYYLEKIWMMKQLSIIRINYEKIELVHPSKQAELIADLKERTGLDVRSVNVARMSFLRDSARLMVSYKPKT
ncbi:MAG: DUF4956 domain-containing protein [Bacteroidetes bacterium]|jgi:hypothetical protein|nr:DUF4956 domain-containing protein [Bacteroidota bacterium]MBT3749262.1 DUF4956 domain-containing protein [Bacteroidota bacterium]MBT4401456.1 DUF4956 domain-containing protein [Bacteroidota bacterium]MBT4409442.1 DUF4956 domain-containing protein [Bacteroidota bacterium]MBT5427057.1 DUF4956 domain-containing protein [Bacteroidota bacterium]